MSDSITAFFLKTKFNYDKFMRRDGDESANHRNYLFSLHFSITIVWLGEIRENISRRRRRGGPKDVSGAQSRERNY